MKDRRGNDAKATEAHKLAAQATIAILKLRGYADIVASVKARYPNFGRANGKGYVHNADGLSMALDLLNEDDPELLGFIKKVLGIRR